MQNFIRFIQFYSLPMVSGILVGTTSIPFPPWALVFCLAPLWIFWFRQEQNLKTIFWGGWLCQFLINIISFHWVAHTTIEFGGFPPAIGYLVLLLFACVAHLYYPISGVIWALLRRRLSPSWQLPALPLVFAICESYHPTIFFWHFGYSWLMAKLPIFHLAEWIGFYGLNLLTLFLNLFIVYFWLQKKKRYIAAALLLFGGAQILGYTLGERFQEGTKTLHALVVQANIGNNIKSEQERSTQHYEYILRRYAELTSQELEKNPNVDFILWPETAYPSLVTSQRRPDYYQRRLMFNIQTFSHPLLTGAYEENQGQVYNSIVLFDKVGHFVKSYKKTMLLAFGEYFPGATILPKLKKWFPMVADFGRGSGPDILTLPTEPHLRLGAQICYESLFDGYAQGLAAKGAQAIVNVTNDSWFGTDFEPYQHLYATLSRAIEFRIPLIRSTNTGISAAITAKGEILQLSPLHAEWAGVFSVPYKDQPEPTFYSYYAGSWPEILLLILMLCLLGGRVAKSRKS